MCNKYNLTYIFFVIKCLLRNREFQNIKNFLIRCFIYLNECLIKNNFYNFNDALSNQYIDKGKNILYYIDSILDFYEMSSSEIIKCIDVKKFFTEEELKFFDQFI